MAGYQIKLNHVTKSKTKVLINRSKVNLDEKILFGNIRHLTDLEIREIMVNGALGNKNTTFHIVNHDIVNHGPEWNAEFSIPIQSFYRHFFLIFWPSRRVILQNKTFSSVLVFQ